jgi:hypothetical protein
MASLCQPVTLWMSAGAGMVSSIAIDSTNVYWTNPIGGSVMQVPIAGGTAVTLASMLPNPAGIGVDAVSVYWADTTANTVQKVPIGGGAPATLTSSASPSPNQVAVDGTSVYWTDLSGGTVSKVSKSGGSPSTLASGLGYAYGIALDATNVYAVSNGGVTKVTKSGLNQQTLATTPGDNSIAVDTTSVYWGYGNANGISKVSILGGSVTTIGTQRVDCLAIDGTNLYFGNTNGVWRIPTAGGTEVQVNQLYASDIKVDATYIYINENSHSVMRLAK